MPWVIVGMLGLCAGVYGAAMRAVPGRGWMKVCEKGLIGGIGIYIGNIALGWFGAQMTLTPVSALLSDIWGCRWRCWRWCAADA